VSSSDLKIKTTLLLLCNWFQLSQTYLVYISEKLAEIVSKFSGGVAVIKVGAATETELEDRKLDDPEESLGANTIQKVMRYYFNENKYIEIISNEIVLQLYCIGIIHAIS
jgi:hypothetical protein